MKHGHLFPMNYYQTYQYYVKTYLEAVFFKIVVTLCLNIKLHLLRLLLVPYLG